MRATDWRCRRRHAGSPGGWPTTSRRPHRKPGRSRPWNPVADLGPPLRRRNCKETRHARPPAFKPDAGTTLGGTFRVDAQALRPWFCQTSDLAGIDIDAQPGANARSKVSSWRQRCLMIAGHRNTTQPLGLESSTCAGQRHRHRFIIGGAGLDLCERRLRSPDRSGIPVCRIASVAPRGVERVHKLPSRAALR